MIKFGVQVLLRKIAQWRAQKKLLARPELWGELQKYLAETVSMGCSPRDYWYLYHETRSRKPREILECGTGVSTLAIARAFMENERDTGVQGRITSMDGVSDWLEMSRRLLPGHCHRFVDFRLSDTVEDCLSMFRGVRYRDVPFSDYDFVLVAG